MAVTFKLRRDLAADWTSDDPVLAVGEPGLETDTGLMKVGNGVKRWTELTYFLLDTPALITLIQTYINNAVLNGVPGASAYDVAVTNGFVGTEAEWLVSLVGPQGIQGPAGATPTNGMLAYTWNGSAYVASVGAGYYPGPNDPGSVPDGSIWDQTP